MVIRKKSVDCIQQHDTMVHAEHGSFNDNTSVGFALKNDTPCLALLDELWGVFRELYMQKWPRYIEKAWYIVFIPVG